MLDLQGKKVLVTGGAGFIGSHLVDNLLRLGCSVTTLDNFDPFYAGKDANVKDQLLSGRFRLIKGSILDQQVLSDAMKGCSVVFHLAAQAGMRYCIEHPEKAETVNAAGTLNVLQEAKKRKVKKFVYASSSSVYGNPVKVPLGERLPIRPTSPYGASKLAAESYCMAFHETYGLPATALRYFSVYGPRGRPDQVVTAFAEAIKEKRHPVIYGDGSVSRDFTYVSDIVSGTILAAMEEASDGEVINLGYGKETSILEVATRIIKHFGSTIQPEFKDGYAGDFPRTLCDNSKAEHLLRWKPQVDFSKGLEDYLGWFGAQGVQRIEPVEAR